MFRPEILDDQKVIEYRSLIPDYFLMDLAYQKITGIVVLDDSREKETAVGVVLLRGWKQWLEIVWVAIAEEYDTDDYGADLIWIATELARAQEKYIGVYSELYPGEEKQLDYYKMAGFIIKEDEQNTLEFRFKDVIPHKDLIRTDRLSHCKSLLQLSRDEKQDLEDFIRNSDIPVAIDPARIRWDRYDQEFSTAFFSEGIPKAVTLISNNNGWISFDFAYSTEPVAFVTTLAFIYQWASVILPDDQEIRVPFLSWQTAELTAKLVPDVKRGKTYRAERELEIKRKGD